VLTFHLSTRKSKTSKRPSAQVSPEHKEMQDIKKRPGAYVAGEHKEQQDIKEAKCLRFT
jgi:hypothetical protein